MAGEDKFYLRGVTYGTFRPDDNGVQFPPKEVIEEDFALMASHGINTVRTYTRPPQHLLDIAQACRLKVMVGLPWEQHITFLDSRERIGSILRRMKEEVRSCGRHPAILCYAIGNEIPAPIVRWYGKRRIEKFLHQLYKAVRQEDPEGLVTYVNYPTTEYLNLPFLDFDCFNVYLETREKLDHYLARLHNLCGDRPLVLAEIGLDSRRNGEEQQAATLDWQLRSIFARGCAGVFVFAWTDEWWRGGHDIEDWDFGLVDRNREPKSALYAVAKTFHELPFSSTEQLPRISVVVCSYNGSATIRDTMEGLMRLDYPDYEVIVVNDGSTDKLAEIVSNYPYRLISTPNRGLSQARNTGMYAATGEIVAYIDDDAYPDPHWLRYLAYAYLNTGHAGIGGPNLPPPEDGPVAQCVANAPGGPVHVLTTDETAEHIPGCNMSFRRDVLLEIGGFDPIYRAAGDDVDICWRIQETGRTIGFHPAALVWHHRRNSIRAYWKQQKGYGKAEALLEKKWPEKYNAFGHVTWSGRLYGNGVTRPIKLRKEKVFHGTWGSALFQSVYQPAPDLLTAFPLMPEWYLLLVFLGVLSLIGFTWPPLLWFWLFFLAAGAVVLIQAGISAAGVTYQGQSKRSMRRWLLTTCLHVIQPMARLSGRIKHGLTPWRKRVPGLADVRVLLTGRQLLTHWSESWRASEDWLAEIESNLTGSRYRAHKGGHFDRWDLQSSTGLFSSARGLLAIEEHGGGKQFLRFSIRPHFSRIGLALILIFLALSAWAVSDDAYPAAAMLGMIALSVTVKLLADTASAVMILSDAFHGLGQPGQQEGVVPVSDVEPSFAGMKAEDDLMS